MFNLKRIKYLVDLSQVNERGDFEFWKLAVEKVIYGFILHELTFIGHHGKRHLADIISFLLEITLYREIPSISQMRKARILCGDGIYSLRPDQSCF